eukprot:TRINITY_DN3934_c0_g1_i6.p2 TRINITY_DN3934_c0_g1~~TRINITY_DN3934_c0_g1_i6.p2  ORF type:complete len:128 (-),score=21.20 TRINITY_DN3934_c0_g1_i6:426-809(-)
MDDAKEHKQINYSPFKGDVFSLGLVALRMCGIEDEKILEAKTSKEWNQANFYQLFKLVEKTHGKLCKILAQMLNRNVALRPSWLTVCKLLQDFQQAPISAERLETQYIISKIATYLNGANMAYENQN